MPPQPLSSSYAYGKITDGLEEVAEVGYEYPNVLRRWNLYRQMPTKLQTSLPSLSFKLTPPLY
jgi:hypothetical protein